MTPATLEIRELLDAGQAELTTGPFGTQLKAAEYVTDGTPVINVRNIGYGTVRGNTDVEHVGAGTTRRLARHLLQRGDIVFGRKGAVERHAFIGPSEAGWLQGSDCLRLRLRSDLFVPQFVSYYLQTDQHMQWIQNQCAFGATMASLNQDVLSRIELPAYPVRAQHKIVSILSAFDDLIENNNRRIKILEEIAQRIYREWFVDFRYPGHENVPLVYSELGPIPDGWVVRRLADVAHITMGQSPPSEFYNRTGDGLPFHQGVGTYGVHFPHHETYSTSGSRIAEARDVLVSVRAPVGRINVADCKLILGRGLCAVRSRTGRPAFTLWLLKNVFRTEDSLGSGAIFNAVKRSDMEGLLLVCPTSEPSLKYEQIAKPALDLIQKLTKASENAKAIRDLLLPRLISGDIDVDNLNIALEDQAALMPADHAKDAPPQSTIKPLGHQMDEPHHMLDYAKLVPEGQLLYHYTDAKGLNGIVSTGELWATNARYLNDLKETRYFSELVVEAIEQRLAIQQDELVREYLVKLRALWGDPPTGDLYVFCLTTEADQLGQWRAYGGMGGGFCLGFLPGSWWILGPSSPKRSNAPWDVRLERVEYRPDEQRGRIDKHLSSLCGGIIHQSQDSDGKRKAVDAALAHSNSWFSAMVPQVKHPSFAEEQESRIAYAPVRPSSDPSALCDVMKFRVAPSGIVPYVALPLDTDSCKLPLKVVRVGPGSDREPTKAAVERLLAVNGYTDVEVTFSDIPLRSHPLRDHG